MNSTRSFTPAMRILLILSGIAVTLWGMTTYASYINAAALAVLIALTVGPVIDWLRKRGLPKWAILVLVLLLVIIGLGLFAALLIYATAQFGAELPALRQQAQALTAQVQAWLQARGLGAAGSAALAGAVDAGGALDWLGTLLRAITSTLSSVVTILLILTFLFVDVIVFPGRLAWQANHGHGYARRVADFTIDLRQYIVVMAIISVCIGTLDTIWFVILGVPGAPLWGVLAGILNFIPFIGFWFGLIPPAVLTLVQWGPERMLLMAAGYVLVNATVQNVIQPRLVVSRLNLTPLMNLLSSTFWVLVLGPIGAIIGVPLSMAVRSLLLAVDPDTRWVADLMGSTTPDQKREESTAADLAQPKSHPD